MAGKIIIDKERCKGCGLCVIACPKNGIVISEQSNQNGFFPAEFDNCQCTGCGNCAIICGEAVIEVYRDSEIVAIKSDKKKSTMKNLKEMKK